jgi:urea transport system substrate-binding protein
LYVPFDLDNFQKEYETIQAAKPDLILSTINGASNIPLFRQFMELGFDPSTSPIFATSIGESGLRSILPRYTKGHYASWTFFQSLDSERARAFVSRYQEEYGTDRPVHDPMESAYTQVFLWKEAVERAGSISAEKVREILERTIEIEGPGGLVRIDPRNHHMYKRMRIGRIRADQQFDIVHESPDLIRPEPYPSFAFPGWNCDWTQGGIEKGPAIDLGY